MAVQETGVTGLMSTFPLQLWTAVIAAGISSLIAFVGVIVSNRSNAKRLQLQLDHDAREKSRDRIIQMRRNIYLDGVRTFNAAMGHLGKIPTLDPRRDDLMAPLVAFNAIGAQIQLVANQRTSVACAEVGRELTSLFFKMAGDAQPMFDLTIEAESLRLSVENAHTEMQRLLQEIKSANSELPARSASADLWDAYAIYEKKLVADLKRLEECGAARLGLQDQYSRHLLPAAKNLMKTHVPMLVELRAELEMTSDLAEMQKRSETAFGEFDGLLSRALDRYKTTDQA